MYLPVSKGQEGQASEPPAMATSKPQKRVQGKGCMDEYLCL